MYHFHRRSFTGRCGLAGALLLTLILGMLTTVRAQQPQPQQPATPEKMADIYYKASDYAKALPLYMLLLKDPGVGEKEMARIQFHIGQCYTAQHQYPDAIRAFDEVTLRYAGTEWAEKALLRKGAVETGLLNKPRQGLATWQILIQRSKSEYAAEALFYSLAWYLLHKERSQCEICLRKLQSDHASSPYTARALAYMGQK